MTDDLRIDDLARAAGVATTTIRLYQHRGLLPGPRLEGRTGWYGPVHLERLRLIARLQAEGHSLAGIGRLVDTWERGADLGDLVGREASLATILGTGREVVLSPAELAERMPAEAFESATMQRAVDLGLVALTDDGQVRVPDGRFVEAGPALAALGVPLAVVLDEWEVLAGDTDRIAGRFVDLFEEHLLPGTVEDLDAAALAALGADLARLHHLAGQVVQAALDASIARVARRRLAALTEPPDPHEPSTSG